MEKDYLTLERASVSRPSGQWNDDVLADGAVVGRIFQVHATPVGMPWMWTLAFGHHEDRNPTHGLLMTCVRAIAWLPSAATENAWKAKGPGGGGASLQGLKAVTDQT